MGHKKVKTVSLDVKLIEKIKEYGKRAHLSFSTYINQILWKYIREKEKGNEKNNK